MGKCQADAAAAALHLFYGIKPRNREITTGTFIVLNAIFTLFFLKKTPFALFRKSNRSLNCPLTSLQLSFDLFTLNSTKLETFNAQMTLKGSESCLETLILLVSEAQRNTFHPQIVKRNL